MHTWPFECPRPFAHKTGVFFLNVRVPSDLAGKVRATRIRLPVEDRLVTIAVTDKVFLSLKTKDPTLARTRFVAAYGALVRHWEAVRTGPKPLTHKQLVALAGYAYRERVARFENDPNYGPDTLRRQVAVAEDAFREWKYGDGDGLGEISDDHARFLSAIQRPSGPQLLAFETRADVVLDLCTVTYDEALEHLFGDNADTLCARRAIVVDVGTRVKLLREIAEVVRLAGAKLSRNMSGDYAEDRNLTRFPAFEEAGPKTPASKIKLGRTTLLQLFQDWRSYFADKRAASTIRRYTPSVESLIAHLGATDIRLIVEDDLWAWAEKRRDVDGIAPGTINRNDLVAVSAVFQFATTRNGQRLLATNPARGVKLDCPNTAQTRDRTFHHHEVKQILLLAREARTSRYPKAAASRRWAPWICAYTGARIQEVCWLRQEDIWREGSIWVVRFPKTKEARARTVPLHDALIEEGFVDFWLLAQPGSLFTGDRPQKAGVKRSPAELRASEIAAWIQDEVQLEPGVSPNHGWRPHFPHDCRRGRHIQALRQCHRRP